jgi:hypothetical protein
VNVRATAQNGSTVASNVMIFNVGSLPAGVNPVEFRENLNADEASIMAAGIDKTTALSNSNGSKIFMKDRGGYSFPGSLPPEGGEYELNQYYGTYSDVATTVRTPARTITRTVAQNFGFVTVSPDGNPAGPFQVTGVTTVGGGSIGAINNEVSNAANSILSEGAARGSLRATINVILGRSSVGSTGTAITNFSTRTLIPSMRRSSGIRNINLRMDPTINFNNITIRGVIPSIIITIMNRVLTDP